MCLDLYGIAHFLKGSCPFIWTFVESVNECFFCLLFGKRVEALDLNKIPIPDGYYLKPITNIPTNDLVAFFERQPEEAFKFFKPHGFDEKSIRALQRNKSFLGYVLLNKHSREIVGYCFNRSFFNGKGFRGRMVDVDYRGKGLGTAMNKILNEVGFGIGLRLFESVSKDNVASYRSALSASNVKVVKELPHNELYLEIMPD